MAKKTNCTVKGKAMYRLRAQIGKDESGVPVFKNFYADNKKAAELKRDTWLSKFNGSSVDTSSSFAQLAKYYTYNVLIYQDLAPSTIDLYERQYRSKIAPANFTIKLISDIKSSDINAFLLELASGKLNGENIKINPSAISNTVKYLKHFYTWLSTEGYCDNLMLGIKTPKTQASSNSTNSTDNFMEKNVFFFTDFEIKKILATDNRLHFLFSLALSSGLRIGEILALKNDDIKDGLVSVSKQLNEHYKVESDGHRERVCVVKDPKAPTSVRKVPLPKNILDEFERYKKIHTQEMLKKGYRTDLIFTTETGSYIDFRNLRRAWKRHLKACNVPIYKFHACRATFCTMLCRNNVPLETASKLMGHSDINVTAKFYRMVGTTEMQNAVKAIEHLFATQ